MGNLRTLHNVQPGSIVYLDPSHTKYDQECFAIVVAIHFQPAIINGVRGAAVKAYDLACGWLTRPSALASLMLIGCEDVGILVDAHMCVEVTSRDKAAQQVGRSRADLRDAQDTVKMISAFIDKLRKTVMHIRSNEDAIQAGKYNRAEIGDDPELPKFPPSLVLSKASLALAIGHVFCLEGDTEAGFIDGSSEITILSAGVTGRAGHKGEPDPDAALIEAVRAVEAGQTGAGDEDEDEEHEPSQDGGTSYGDRNLAILQSMPAEPVEEIDASTKETDAAVAEIHASVGGSLTREQVKPSFGLSPLEPTSALTRCPFISGVGTKPGGLRCELDESHNPDTEHLYKQDGLWKSFEGSDFYKHKQPIFDGVCGNTLGSFEGDVIGWCARFKGHEGKCSAESDVSDAS